MKNLVKLVVFFLFMLSRTGMAADKAQFVGAAETCQDGTQLTFNTQFTKTWTIKNTGTTTWTQSYYFSYVSTNFAGKLSKSQSKVFVTQNVPVGSQYVVSIPMKAPASATNNTCLVSTPAVNKGTGECEQWQFHSSNGSVIKVDNSTTIWALIKVFPTLNGKPAGCNIVSSAPTGACSLVSPSPSGVGGQPLNALLDWSCVDPDNDIVDNYFEIDDNSNFSSLVCGGFLGGVSSFQMPGGCGNSLVSGKTYYWRAYAKDSYGQVNSSKPTWSFTTQPANNPPTCGLSAPANAAQNQPLNVTLSWSCSDPDAGGSVKNYCVTLDDSSNFSSPLYDSCWGNGQVVTSWQPNLSGAPLSFGTTYYWRVRAYDNLNAVGAWTGTRSFTTIASNLCADLTQKDAFGDPCKHDEDGDGVLDVNDPCPFSANDNINNPCNHDEDGDGVLDVNDPCPFSANDNINNPCNHDEDGDGVPDVNDACPFLPNDGINDPCNPNDNGNLVFTGGAINVTVPQGAIHQSQKFTLSNNGSSPLNYTMSASPAAPWLTVSRNGGSTNALQGAHVLAPGQKDSLVVSMNTRGLQPGVTVVTTIQLTSTDPSQGSVSIPVTLHVQQAPYCPTVAACMAAPTQTLGNRSLVAQNIVDPVNSATGNYAYHHLDLSLPARGLALHFERTYNSADKYLGPLGFGWTHTYNVFVTEWGDGSVQVKWGDGHSEIYAPSGNNSYTAPAGVFSQLSKNANGSWKLLTKNHVQLDFASGGFLTTMTDRQGNTLALIYDSQSRLSQVTGAFGKTLTLTYDATELFKIVSVSDSAGRSVQFQYTQDDLTGFTDAGGAHFAYQYDANHQLTEATNPLQQVLVHNSYDAFSRVLSQQDGNGNITQIQYETPAVGKVKVTDPLGHTYAQVYDGQLRIAQSGDPAGHSVQYQYNASDLRTMLVDRNGKAMTASYDARGNLLSVTDPLGAVTQFTYDPVTDDLLTSTEPSGHVRSFAYDNEGNLAQISETVAGVVVARHYTYNTWGQLLTATDPKGHTTTLTYDNQGRLATVTDAMGGVTQLSYDNVGRVVSRMNALGQLTTYQYNATDRVTAVIDPDGLSNKFSYDADQNLTKLTDRSGHSSLFQWNANGFLSAAQDALGNTTTIGYDALNRKTQITDAENRTTQLQYDLAGNLFQILDPAGKSVQLGYDAEGNVVSRVDAAGKSWSTSYDALGRPTASTDPLGNVTSYAYDLVNGTLDHVTDADGHVTQYHHDPLHRLSSVVDALGQTTTYAYDLDGNLVALMNAGGHTTSFNYDALDRQVGKTDALGAQEHAVYDVGGRLNQFTDQRGKATHLAYDSMNRLSSMSFADGKAVGFTYDANGNRLTRTDELGVAGYTYDVVGRLLSFHDPQGFQIAYQYDKTGLPKQLTYPGGHVVQYAYNAARQMTQVTDWLNQVTSYQYDAAGRLSQTLSPNGFKTTYGYDSASRLTHLANTRADLSALSTYDFTLNALGNRVQVTKMESLTPWIAPQSAAATYDAENQLLVLAGSPLGYDQNGNLITHADPAGPTDYFFNDQDRLGSLTSPQGVTSFVYDGDGNRLAKTSSGETTKLVVDPNRALPDLIAEADGNGNIQRYYVYGLGLTSQISADGSQVRHYHYDALGSTIALSDPSGSVTDQYLYDEFGGVNRRTGSTPNPFQYVGRLGVQNDGTGLYAMRARYYDPTAGRFISRDPIGFAGGMNLYGYGGNDPISRTDPSGLFSFGDAAAWAWDGINKLNDKVVAPVGAALFANDVAAKAAVFRKGITIKPSFFPFDLKVEAVKNASNNLRGLVPPGAGRITKALKTLGDASEILAAFDFAVTSVDEILHEHDHVTEIYNSTEIPDNLKPHAALTEATLTAGRIAAKTGTGFVDGVDDLVQLTKWINPVYWEDRIFFGGRNFESSGEGVHQLVEQANQGVDSWTAINLRNSVQGYLNSFERSGQHTQASSLSIVGAFKNVDLSGGRSSGKK